MNLKSCCFQRGDCSNLTDTAATSQLVEEVIRDGQLKESRDLSEPTSENPSVLSLDFGHYRQDPGWHYCTAFCIVLMSGYSLL